MFLVIVFLTYAFTLIIQKLKSAFATRKGILLLLKTVKVTLKNMLTQLRISTVVWHNSFVAMPVYQEAMPGAAGTAWSICPGPKLPTAGAAHKDDTWAPNRPPISLGSKDRENRHCLQPLFSQYMCPLLSRLAGSRTTFPPSPVEAVPKPVTTEATSSAQRCLKPSNLFFGRAPEFSSSKLS